MANWENIENAILEGIRMAASGFSTIYWDYQAGDRLVRPFVTLHIASDVNLGATDELQVFDTPGQPAGEELTFKVIAQKELVVRVSAYARSPVRASARSILFDIQTGIKKPSVIAHYDMAGLAIIERGGIQHLPVLFDSTHESRAVMEIRFRMCDSVSDLETYIETVETTPGFNT